MGRRPSSTLTEVELEILRVLWQRGPSTVREVHDTLREKRTTGHSTTLKMMQVMTEKGLLFKDNRQRPQVYRAAISEEQAQTQFVDDLLQRVFGGAAEKLILQALKSRHVSPKDLEHVKKLIERLEGESR